MAHTTQSASCLFTIVCLCLYFSRSHSVEAALKLDCPGSSEQEFDHSFKAISIFNESTFSFLRVCQKNLSLSNVSVEMVCLTDGKSHCQTRLRFSWSFTSTVGQGLLKEVTLTLMQVSPIPGGRQNIDCEAVFYDDYEDDDDHHNTQSSSLDIFVVDYDCCDADQVGHSYFATLKAIYDEDLPSCKVGTPLTLIPARLTPKEDDAFTSSRNTEFTRGQDEEDHPVTFVIYPGDDQKSFSFVRAAIVISFVVVVCVVVVIVAYLCIRRGSNTMRRRLTERENSSQPFDLTSGSDDIEAFQGSSYLHNCPHCIHETISNTIPDQRGILDSSGSDSEEDFGSTYRQAQLLESQLDSGVCSGGPMFLSSENNMRTLSFQH